MGSTGSQPKRALSITSDGSTPRKSKRNSTTFKTVRQLNDFRYGGETRLVQRSKHGRLFIKLEKTVDSQLALERESRKINRKVLFPDPYIVKIDSFHYRDEQSCCNILWKIMIYVEYMERDLAKEILEKIASKSIYPETELEFLMENMICGLESLRKQSSPHRDIRPCNILISSFGLYKYVDPYLMNLNTENPIRTKSNIKGKFVAPEELDAIKNGKDLSKLDPYLNDVFSMGMTLLEAATLKPSRDLYNYSSLSINVSMLQERLMSLKEKYSTFIYSAIKDMLEIDVNQRATITNLFERVDPQKDLSRKKDIHSFVIERRHANQSLSHNEISVSLINNRISNGSTREPTPKTPSKVDFF